MRFRTIGATAVLLAVICAVSLAVASSSTSDGDPLVVDGISYGTNPDGTPSP